MATTLHARKDSLKDNRSREFPRLEQEAALVLRYHRYLHRRQEHPSNIRPIGTDGPNTIDF